MRDRRRFAPFGYPLGVILLVLLVGHRLEWVDLTWLAWGERAAYDWRRRVMTPATEEDRRVVVVAIDEASLRKVGPWPWSRERLAALVDVLFADYQIGVLGLAVDLTDQDRDDPRSDHRLAASLEDRPVVLGYQFTPSPVGGVEVLPSPLITLEELGGATSTASTHSGLITAGGIITSRPRLQRWARGAGFVDNPLPDADGVMRRIPALQQYRDGWYPSFALAVVRVLMANPPLTFGFGGDGGRLEWMRLGSLRLPLDEQGALWIPRHDPGATGRISAFRVLNHTVDSSVLANTVVLVAVTAPSSLAPGLPGIAVQADLVSGILDQRLKSRPGYALGLEVAWLLGVGVVLIVLMPRLRAIQAWVVASLVMVLTIWANLAAWKYLHAIFFLAAPASLPLLLVLARAPFGFKDPLLSRSSP